MHGALLAIVFVISHAAVVADEIAPAVPQPIGASEADPLRGPRAAIRATTPTIVHRSFEGRLIPVDGEPETAALRALPLSPQELEAVESVVARRIAVFDELVRTHVPELESGLAALARLEHATSGAERWTAIAEFSTAWEVFRPWRARGSVIDEVAEIVPEALRRRANRMVHLYRVSLAHERAADLGSTPNDPQVQAHIRLEAFGAMLQSSFERQQRGGDEDLERLSRALELTPEQAERARAIFSELALKEMRRDAKRWDRFQTLSAFMRELTPQQRARAWRFIYRESR